MGGDGYYPEYYLRKRKRDRMYTIVWRTIFAVVVVGGLGALCGFLGFHYLWQPHQNPAGVTKELANTRNEIGTEQKLAQAAQDRPPTDANPQYAPVDLKKLQYSDSSFPATSVSLQGIGSAPAGGQPAGSAPAEPPAAGQEPGTTADSGAPGSGDSGTLQTPPPAGSAAAVPPPAPRPPDSAPAQAPPAKPDEAKAAADKAAEKKAADAKKAQADKDKAAKEAAAKEAKDQKDTKPARDAKDDKTVQPGKTVFHVYGGSAISKDKAEAMKQQLSTIGFSGQIVPPKTPGSDYLVLVAEVDDYTKADALAGELRKHGFAPFTTKVNVKEAKAR
jgi:hypothetical protein